MVPGGLVSDHAGLRFSRGAEQSDPGAELHVARLVELLPAAGVSRPRGPPRGPLASGGPSRSRGEGGAISPPGRHRQRGGGCAPALRHQDHHGAPDTRADPLSAWVVRSLSCRLTGRPGGGFPERPDDSCPAGAGHPHAPSIGAARELAATAMLLKEGVQVAKQARHGRECSSAGGRARWVVMPKTGFCAITCARSPTEEARSARRSERRWPSSGGGLP
jgi:hypothetical protein